MEQGTRAPSPGAASGAGALWDFSILLYSLVGSSSDHHPAKGPGLGWAGFPAGHQGWWQPCGACWGLASPAAAGMGGGGIRGPR